MKDNNSIFPLLSIVTICFNDCDALIKTFNSVKKQNFINYEYLVIDGGSKDDTVKFLKKNNEIIDYWVSENDNGIYDAFNKGIIKSKGKYIHLLNAGDTYMNSQSLTNIDFNCGFDFICSSVLKKSSKDWVWLPFINSISNYVNVSHPGLIVKKEVYLNNLYSTKYKIVSDELFIYNNVKPEKTKIYNDILVEMSDGGISTELSISHELEKHKILIKEKFRNKEKFILHIKYILIFFKKVLIK
jgi:glycosyltransferase involved in cell wall biosynthesis